MHAIQYLRKCFCLRPGVIVFPVLLWSALLGRADRFPPDPVEALRQTLNATTFEADLPVLERELPKRLEALWKLSDIRKALDLQEWRGVSESPLMRRSEKVEAYKWKARIKLAQTFESKARAILKEGTTSGRLALMDMLAEIGSTIFVADYPEPLVKGYPKGLSRALAPDVAALVKDSEATPELRIAAARTLGLIYPDPSVAVPALQQVLTSGTEAERRAAAEGLERLMRNVGQLAGRQRSTTGTEADPEDVLHAVRAVVPVAGRGMKDPNPEVRRRSAEAFLEAAMAVRNQVPQLRSGGEFLNVQALGKIRADLQPVLEIFRDQVPLISQALGDRDSEVRLTVQRALEELGNTRLRLLHLSGADAAPPPAPAGNRRGAASGQGEVQAVALNQQPAPAADPLLQALQASLPALDVELQDRNPEVRLGAIEVMETMGDAAQPAVPLLIRALRDPNHFVRWAAVRTLGKIAPVQPAATVPIIGHLLFDEYLEVRLSAATALSRFGPAAEAAVPDLVRAMQEPDSEVKEAAIRALPAIGTGAQSAVPALAAALSDSDGRIRQSAAEVLGQFGALAARAEPALRRALRDEESDVRRAASDALLNILQSEK